MESPVETVVAHPDGGSDEARRTEKERAQNAERQRRYRQRKKEKLDAQRAEKTPEEKKATEEAQDFTEKQLGKALAATVEGLVDAVAVAKTGDPAIPAFGATRAKVIGDAWAPILKPYINESNAHLLAVGMASAFTVNELQGFRRELAEYRKAGEVPRPSNVIDIKRQKSVEPDSPTAKAEASVGDEPTTVDEPTGAPHEPKRPKVRPPDDLEGISAL